MLTFNGSLLQKIKTKSGKSPNDIAVTNDGDLLYADWPLKRVYKVKKNGQTDLQVIFWLPCIVTIKLNLKMSVTRDLQLCFLILNTAGILHIDIQISIQIKADR